MIDRGVIFDNDFSRHDEGTPGTTSYLPSGRISVRGGSRFHSGTVEDAHTRGYEEGYNLGMAEAQASAGLLEQNYSERADSLLASLAAAARNFDSRSATDFDGLGQEVCDAAMALTEAILDHELTISRDRVRHAVRRAFREAPDSRTAIVRLNPSDAEAFGAGEEPNPDFTREAGGRELTFISDERVAPGGAIVEIGSCTIDSRVEAAINRVRAILQGDV